MKMVFLCLAIAASFVCGCVCGIHHAVNDSVIYTVDVYDPEIVYVDPKTGNEYDQQIFIELDGHTYIHGMYQG